MPIRLRQHSKLGNFQQFKFDCGDISRNVLLAFFKDVEGILKKLEPDTDGKSWINSSENFQHMKVGDKRVTYSDSQSKPNLIITSFTPDYSMGDIARELNELSYVDVPKEYL